MPSLAEMIKALGLENIVDINSLTQKDFIDILQAYMALINN